MNKTHCYNVQCRSTLMTHPSHVNVRLVISQKLYLAFHGSQIALHSILESLRYRKNRTHQHVTNLTPELTVKKGLLLLSMKRYGVDSGVGNSTTLFFNLAVESSLRVSLVSSGDSILITRTMPFLEIRWFFRVDQGLPYGLSY
jgi:hypothetical protein